MFDFLFRKKSKLEQENPHLEQLFKIIKIKPRNPEVYLQALRHKSVYESSFQNNERLEFLGDSILDSVVAEVLYEKYPQAKEGFLTRIRSRIVSRTSLNNLGISLHLHKLLEVQMSREITETSLSGNALEALIGAIYIDQGFDRTNRFIREKLIEPYINFDSLLTQEPDPKSRLIEKSQKYKVRVVFKTAITKKEDPQSFVCTVIYNGEEIAEAFGQSKKKAEQKAAAEALRRLESSYTS